MTPDEQKVIDAALNLFQGSAAFLLPIPNTTPPLYIVCGEREQILELLRLNMQPYE
jgi:hypothetical protein